MKMILNGKKDMTLQAHRNSYKSTCLAVCMALMCVEHGDKNILLLRKTSSLVRDTVRSVRLILLSPLFRSLCLEEHGQEPLLLSCTGMSLTTSFYTAPRGCAQLQGISVGTDMTGMHADIIVTDDIVSQKDRRSAAERERTALVYQELQNIRTKGGRIINIGTPWHREDCFRLMPEPRKYDCYQTHILSSRELNEIRSHMAPSLFAANYELRLIADENALFTGPVHYAALTLLQPGGFAHVDASYGGSDRTALTLISRSGEDIVLFGKLYKKSVTDCLEQIGCLCREHDVNRIYSETNSDRGFLSLEFRRRGFTARGYHESCSKEIKIGTYLCRHWKELRFLPGTDPEYISEILDYTPRSPHDDAPDSAASALRILENLGST